MTLCEESFPVVISVFCRQQTEITQRPLSSSSSHQSRPNNLKQCCHWLLLHSTMVHQNNQLRLEKGAVPKQGYDLSKMKLNTTWLALFSQKKLTTYNLPEERHQILCSAQSTSIVLSASAVLHHHSESLSRSAVSLWHSLWLSSSGRKAVCLLSLHKLPE